MTVSDVATVLDTTDGDVSAALFQEVLPRLLADAWEAGYDAATADACQPVNGLTANPYRPTHPSVHP